MNDLTRIKAMAAEWRQERGYADKGGVVVIYQNQVCGWVNELRDPSSWQPGCIATDSAGNQWQAVGGNEYDGATEWQSLGLTTSDNSEISAPKNVHIYEKSLKLVSFGLPQTFPNFMLPDEAVQFMEDTQKGMSGTELLDMANMRGFSPQWRQLLHIGEGVYGLGLNVNGMQVPFMVRMSLSAE